jgi:hypothetical protein
MLLHSRRCCDNTESSGKQEDKDGEQITSLNDVPHGTWQGHRKVAFFFAHTPPV